MTTEQPTARADYNPFHHLQDLHYIIDDGDATVRLAFLEVVDKLGVEYGPYLTALEAASFSAKLALAIYARMVPEGERQETFHGDEFDYGGIDWYHEQISRKLTKNVTVVAGDYYGGDIYNLSFADQDRVLAAVAKLTDKQVQTLNEGYATTLPKRRKAEKICDAVASAVSETFNLKGFGKDPVTLHQGGKGVYPLRVRQVSKETGRFHMTRNGLKEWGLSIPKHPDLPDNTNVAVNISYPEVPDGVILHIKSSTDDVPDGEGGTKSEQINAHIKKGEFSMQVSLLNKNLKYHSWTFSIGKVAPAT